MMKAFLHAMFALGAMGWVATCPAEDAPPAAPAQPVPAKALFIPTYADPPPAGTAQWPSLPLRTPEAATCFGLQFGTASTDVVYFVFDRKTLPDLPDLLFVLAPGTNQLRLVDTVHGGSKRIGLVKGRRFKVRRLEGTVGGLPAQHSLEMTYGVGAENVLHLLDEVRLTRPGGGSCSFVLAGSVGEALLVRPDAMGLLRPLQTPEMHHVTSYEAEPVARVNLMMGKLRLLPGSNMDRDVQMSAVRADTQQRVDRERASLQIRDYPGVYEEDPSFSLQFKRLKPNVEYDLVADIDLGALLGPLQGKVRMKLPEKTK